MTSYYTVTETEYDHVNDELYATTYLVCSDEPTPEALEVVMGIFYDSEPMYDGEPLFTSEEYRSMVLESGYVEPETGCYVYEVSYS